MVLRYFKLREQPFGVTPDPRFLFASATHREALASILYGLQAGLGFVALTATPGMGKTTLLFEALRRVRETTRTVFLFQTVTTPDELVRALLLDLGVKDIPGTLVEMQAHLNSFLVSQSTTGKRLIVVIDEAQNLSESVLEAVRMLSNFETARQKLMQIVLSGQPQLAEKLALPELLPLRQRISIFAQLQPFSEPETAAYVNHRLRVAGYEGTEPLFTPAALKLIAEQSLGIPRNINNLCFNALSIACALRQETIDADVIREVVNDLDISYRGLNPPARPPVQMAPAPPAGHPVFQPPAQSVPAPARPASPQPVPFAQPPVQMVFASESESGEEPERKPRTIRFTPSMVTIAAAILLVVLVAGWLFLRNGHSESADVPVSAPLSAPAQATTPADPGRTVKPAAEGGLAASAQPISPISAPRTRLVQVRQGQSLFDICTQNYPRCLPQTMREIVRLNPSVANPDHIESGQSITLPVDPVNANVSK